MKSEALTGLVSAGWPVLLLDGAVAVLVANRAAAAVFGPAAEPGAFLASVWLAENAASPAVFMARAERTGAPTPLKLLGADGVPVSFSACVCAFIDGLHKRFVLQLLPPPPEADNAAAEARIAAAEARTVAAEADSMVAAEARIAAAEARSVAAEARIAEAEARSVAAEARSAEAEADSAAAKDRIAAAEARSVAAEADSMAAEARIAAAEARSVAAEAGIAAAKARSAAAGAGSVVAEARIAAAEARRVAAEDRIAAAEARSAEAEARRVAAEADSAAAKDRSAEAEARSVAAEADSAAAKDRIAEAEGRIAAAEARSAEAEDRIAAAKAGSVAAEARSVAAGAGSVVAEARNVAAEARNAAAEAGLAHKQKLDCALQLARTVSLDFNNALTTILGHTSLVLSKMEPANPWRNSLIEVEKSAARAAEIANDLGAFSRPEKEAKAQQSGNLNQLLQRNAEMFQSTKLDKEVAWSLKFERKLYSARFDEAKMQQALVKIMENALEALGPRGHITLQTKNIDLTQPTQDRNAQLAAGAYVCAEIADDGCGIEAGVLPRIFEPFFTTKRASKHRGLGLAWVYGIVTNHGGGVAVSSQPGAGTSVRVYLPADKKFVKEDVANVADLSGKGTILMVDDEDLLLTMGETVLSAYGYKVLTANSGQKALDIIERGNPSIDLIITDLVMPNMSGRELVDRVRQLSPEMRIVSSSGYVRPTDDQDHTAYLQKPFSSQDLLLKVKQALAAE